MSTELQVPKNIAAMLANKNVANVQQMDTGSGGVPRISLKKSKFTAKNGEEEIKLGEEIHVVILGIDPPIGFAKTFYESGYTAGSADAPDCSSDDGVRPNSFVNDPQHDKCATCPKNQWGSAKSMSGKKAKACKDSKRLHVKLAEELDNPDAPIYIMGVTVLSLKPFGDYGKSLAKQGIPTPSIVITKLGFDEDASVPKLTFEAVGVMDEANCTKALEIAEEKPWDSFKNTAPVANKQAIEAPVESEEAKVDADALNNW